jgi:hypothetical protein
MVPNKRTERARALLQGDDLLDPLVAGPPVQRLSRPREVSCHAREGCHDSS